MDITKILRENIPNSLGQFAGNIIVGFKAVSIKDPNFMAQFPGWTGTSDKKLTRPYTQISAVYAAVRAKARNIAQVPFVITKQGSEEPIKSGPLFDLFENVNPTMSKYQLWEALVTCLDTRGQGFIFKDREYVKGIPVFLWVIHPKAVKPAHKNNIWVGWWLSKGGRTEFWSIDEVIQPKYYNPYDDLEGLSPLKALELGLETEWGAIKYNKLYFDQDGTPGTVFSTEQQLSDPQYARMKNDLIAKRKGVDHAHEALLLEGGVKVASIRLSNKDMEFLEQRKFTREEIAMVYGTPKAELQLYEDINYATANSADLSFWKKTLIPLMVLIQDKLNTDFLKPLGYHGTFDIRSVDVLNQEILEKAEAAKEFWGMGVPFNQINERLNLGFEEVPEGDAPYGGRYDQNRLVDVTPKKSLFRRIPELEITDIEPIKIDPEEMLKAARGEKWKSLMAPILPIMGKAARAVREYFFEAEQKLLKKIIKKPDMVTKISVEDIPSLDDILSDEKLRGIMEEYINNALDHGVNSIQLDFVLPPEDEILAIGRRVGKVTAVNETVRKQLTEKLRDILGEAMAEGWNEEQKATAIIDGVKDIMGMAKKRARTIARTETHGAYSEGRNLGMAETEPKSKMWITSRDANVRDAHAAMDGEVVPFDEPFSNGLMYPLVYDGSAEEVINCRCVHIAIYEEGI